MMPSPSFPTHRAASAAFRGRRTSVATLIATRIATLIATLIAAVLLAGGLLAPPARAQAATGSDPNSDSGAVSTAADGQAVLDAVIDNLRGLSERATLDLTVERPDRTVHYRMDVVSDGDQRSLVRVTAPPREAGQAFLSIGNNLLVYSPRLGRSLRLPPSGRSNAFLGSDLSYDDLAGGEYRDQYTATVVGRDAETVTLELVPKPEAPTPYGKLVFVVRAGSYAPESLTFFDQRGNAVKRLGFSDFQDVHGRTIPQRFEVADLLKDGYRTTAVYSGATFGIDVPESCFSEAALERGCF